MVNKEIKGENRMEVKKENLALLNRPLIYLKTQFYFRLSMQIICMICFIDQNYVHRVWEPENVRHNIF